jgi:superfamily II DNA or RNA helicase
MLNGITLRDYQLEAILKLLDHKRGVAKMATNAGKTEVMAGIIKALGVPNTLIIVSSKELLHQTADRFETRLGIKVGKIGDGLWQPEIVTVAMVQTLYSRLENVWLENQLLMVDECHHASSNRMLDVLNKISGPYRFGFSGTPLKHEVLADMKLISATGRLLCEVTNSQLIEQGFSATPYVHLTTITNGAEDKFDAKYQQAYKDMIVDNEYRNLLVADKAKISEGIVLVLVNQISHGHILNKLIPGSVFVHGSHDTEYRSGILEKMRSGGKGVFIASPIFDEGVDVPAIDTIILACGGKSHIKLLQRIGRGMRKKGNGNVLMIHDFIDDTNKYLLKHSEERIDTYVAEGFETILD